MAPWERIVNLRGLLESKSRCASTRELQEQLQRETTRVGFASFSLFCATDSAAGTRFSGVDSLPASYRAAFNDRAMAKLDPVMQHCKGSFRPIAWSRTTYAATGLDDKWERMASCGLMSGVAAALHLPRGQHVFMCGYTASVHPKEGAAHRHRAAALQLLLSCAVEPALETLGSSTLAGLPPPLTSRELECLAWALEGKSAWSTAEILRISESRVAALLQKAMGKLQCVTKAQAIGKAMRLGLLH